jgi:hypothetical protein
VFNQLAAFSLIINIFLQPPVPFIEYIEYTPNLLYLERGP